MFKEIAPDIIDACKRKNKSDQKALYNHYASYVYGICMRYAATKLDAEDMMQDSFVKIFKRRLLI
ncbi:MAG: RNA polymerase sigma factor [Bacteroidales bacterium]